MKKLLLPLALTGCLLSGPAGSFEISNLPLYLTGNVAPNLVLTLDDSGSMRRAFVPELCGDSSDCAALDNRWAKSAHGNGLYYDPTNVYDAPRNADGSSRSTSFSAAWRNGFYTSGTVGDVNFGTKVDLGTAYQPSANLDMQNSPAEGFMSRDVEVTGTTSTTASFTISNLQNISSLLSVVVNGVIMTRSGNTDASCGTRPTASNGFTTYISGSNLRLCFQSNANWQGKPVTVSYLRSDTGPAYYNLFNSSRSGCADKVAQKRNNACYDTVIVSKDEQQNFANWYSFWRTRNLATISAASLTFANLSPTTRVAWQALNACNDSSKLVTSSCRGWTGSYGSNAIKDFNSTQRSNFYNWLFKLPSNGDTPLRDAMRRAGEYFKTTGENSPYDNDFTTANSGQYSCRRNFHVMMTDGIWNDNNGSFGNADQNGQTFPDGTRYQSNSDYARIYADNTPQTLSDLAFYYWMIDLTNLGNNLLPVVQEEDGNGDGNKDSAASIYWNPKNNPASWQHMVNFTIGLGLTEFLAAAGLDWNGDMYGGSYPKLKLGSSSGGIDWPPATTDMGDAGADYGKSAHDLWHAAINSRGRFFSVDSPQALQDAFGRVLSMIEVATPTSAALAASATTTVGSAGQSTRIFQARFDTRYWNGHLYALEVNPDNGSVSGPLWDAATTQDQGLLKKTMPAHSERNIFILKNPGVTNSEATSFAWTSLSEAQKNALKQSDGDSIGSLRLDWLRGDHSMEQRYAGGLFRNRTSFDLNYDGAPNSKRSEWVLGDIISSDPLYVGAGSQNYDQLPDGGSSYAAYVSYKKTRTPMIYVGANDGMLHAFRATDGVEQFAVIPTAVFPNLLQLTKPDYSHRYYVDGSPGGGDAYLKGAWKTVVVSGLRGGGKSVFAVDATNPDQPTASQFMWEFNAGGTDADMGYSYSQPQVVRLKDGSWAAVFGNGYNSSSGGAHLYVVSLSDGTLIKKVTALATDSDNGLSTPTLVDTDGDGIVDTAYAGDLKGNLWKFDLTSASSSGWTASQLFTAQGGTTPQPITVQPKVVKGDNGYWIFLGTGRLLATDDIGTAAMSSKQSFYGLWDNGNSITGRSALVEQTVTTTTSQNGMNLRVTSDNEVNLTSKRGWYMDLPSSGERVITEAMTVIDNVNSNDNRIIFTTAIPSADPCSAQGSSWLMELSFKGRRPTKPVFDLNNDLQFDAADTLNGIIPTGMQSTVGIMDSVTWLDRDANVAFKLTPGTRGRIQTITNRGRGMAGKPQRVNWQQLM